MLLIESFNIEHLDIESFNVESLDIELFDIESLLALQFNARLDIPLNARIRRSAFSSAILRALQRV